MALVQSPLQPLTLSPAPSPIDGVDHPPPSIARWLADLGLLAEGVGLPVIEEDLDLVAETADRLGVGSPAASVLTDRAAPPVVRVRALARVSINIVRALEAQRAS